eukprot:1162062-Pelagomonas_calceolata.AAC.29
MAADIHALGCLSKQSNGHALFVCVRVCAGQDDERDLMPVFAGIIIVSLSQRIALLERAKK